MEKPNLSYIKSMSAGDTNFERRLIRIIKSEFPIEKKSYFENINAGNYKITAGIVHKIKHKISILGLEKGYEITMAYENDLKEGNNTLQSEFEIILLVVTKYLKQL